MTDFLAACSALCIGGAADKARLVFSIFDMGGRHGIISFDELVCTLWVVLAWCTLNEAYGRFTCMVRDVGMLQVILLLTTTSVAHRVAGVTAPLAPDEAEKLATSLFKQVRYGGRPCYVRSAPCCRVHVLSVAH